jgi:tetratricopeptide (TPR) repeat protein
MSLERILLSVQGYMELDMAEEALREFTRIDLEDQNREDVLQIKLFILMRTRSWEEALEICKLLQESNPETTIGYIHGAFCLHEIGQTEEAKEMLLEGPRALLREPTYYYNLACYNAILGDLEEAKKNLQASVKMDEKFREIAKHDPDLKPIKHLI